MNRTLKAIWAQKKRPNAGGYLKKQLVNGVEKRKYQQSRIEKEALGGYLVT
jgi:hypothetical protein